MRVNYLVRESTTQERGSFKETSKKAGGALVRKGLSLLFPFQFKGSVDFRGRRTWGNQAGKTGERLHLGRPNYSEKIYHHLIKVNDREKYGKTAIQKG